MFEQKRIFITGNTGFIGSHLREWLHDGGHFVASSRVDLEHLPSAQVLDGVFQNFDTFIHLAGMSNPTECERQAERSMVVNGKSPVELAKSFWKVNPQGTFIFFSSCLVYGPNTALLTKKVKISESCPTTESTAYARSKVFAEKQLTELAKVLNASLFIVRPFNHTHITQDPIYFAPRVYTELETIANASDTSDQTLRVGNIHIYRDFGALEDLLRAVELLVLKRTDEPMVLNICSGYGIKLIEIINGFSHRLNIIPKIEVDSSLVRPHEPSWFVGDNSKAKEFLGWSPQVFSIETFVQMFFKRIIKGSDSIQESTPVI